MGCGCGGAGARNEAGAATRRTAVATTDGVSGDTHSDTLACAACYAKHLSKAMVELSEFLDDASRVLELAMCVGNLACAEDHASALGLYRERSEIRDIRHSVLGWSPDARALDRISDLSVTAVKMAANRAVEERRRKRAIEAAGREAGNASNE